MLLRTLLAASLFTLAACPHSSGSGGTSTPNGGSNAPVAKGPVNALPDGAPLVSPGEHMTYKLVLQGLDVAQYELIIAPELSDVDGKKTIQVQSHAKAMGLASMAVKIDDNFSSWIDVATGRSLKWTTDEFAKNGKDKERTEALTGKLANGTIPITFHLNDDPPQPEPQQTTSKDGWDYNTFLVALRSWEGAPGSKVSIEILRSRFLWHVDMTIKGKEKLVTDLGDFPALRFDAMSYKLGRDGARFPDTEDRPFSIWVSDDAGRVPLQVVAKTDYGDLKMSITNYEPGNGTPLRQ